MINGNPSGHIIPFKGLGQGDPLLPYLFLLCVERLSSKLKMAEEQGIIQGIFVIRLAPKVSHLLFVDDSIVFLCASLQECGVLKKILRDYEKVSSQ